MKICLIFLSLISLNVIAKPAGLKYKAFVYGRHYTSHKSPVSKQDSVATNAAETICPDDLLTFAQTLIGTPYHFASSNPNYGFDCSGFVGYVFRNFDISVPRSSGDFANVGQKVKLEDAKPGDIILFTGTQKHSRKIGHVGIIVCNADHEIRFIHSTSGKEHGVTITTMDNYYRHRFVRIVRMFKQNDLV